RQGVRVLLEAREGWKVCGEADSGVEAVKLASEMQPDVAVLDLEMAGLDGLEATRQIKKDQPQIEVLIFTMHDAEYLIREVLAAGAYVFVLRGKGGNRPIKAMESVPQHQLFFAAKAAKPLQTAFLPPTGGPQKNSSFPRREREIVQLITDG